MASARRTRISSVPNAARAIVPFCAILLILANKLCIVKLQPLGSEEQPAHWKQKTLTLIGVGVFVLFLAGLGIYTFVLAVSTKLHPDPKDVPSVALAAPSQSGLPR